MLSGTGALAALLVGLLGGVHCAGMCGGIVALLGASLSGPHRHAMLAAYHGGRIASYTFIGALFGGLGERLVHGLGLPQAQAVLALAGGAFLVLLGLYLGGWWPVLARLERLGGRLVWRRLEPLGRRFLPPAGPGQAVLLGMVWGWLPCGLVYSVALWALAAGSALRGATLLLAFGLGTLPNLLLLGWAAVRMQVWFRRPGFRRLAGGLVIALGAVMLVRAATLLGRLG